MAVGCDGGEPVLTEVGFHARRAASCACSAQTGAARPLCSGPDGHAGLRPLVAFRPPAEVLDRATLEATYRSEMIVLPDGETPTLGHHGC